MPTPSALYFEIPAKNLPRATRFYEHTLEITFEQGEIDGHPMAFFPQPDSEGICGALVTGDSYEPSTQGTRVYFRVQDIARTMTRALHAGGTELYAIKDVGPAGLVAEVKDTEGNRIAFIQQHA